MSSPYKQICDKQINWAKRRGISLSQEFPPYTTIQENLFEGLAESTYQDFLHGDGGEMSEEPGKLAKIRALHSTAALAVNVFQYWQQIHQIPTIAAACGFCDPEERFSHSINFEGKFQILESSRRHPNLDVVIRNKDTEQSVYAIECKFTEPFREQKGLNKKYMNLPDWEDIPQTYSIAKRNQP